MIRSKSNNEYMQYISPSVPTLELSSSAHAGLAGYLACIAPGTPRLWNGAKSMYIHTYNTILVSI